MRRSIVRSDSIASSSVRHKRLAKVSRSIALRGNHVKFPVAPPKMLAKRLKCIAAKMARAKSIATMPKAFVAAVWSSHAETIHAPPRAVARASLWSKKAQ